MKKILIFAGAAIIIYAAVLLFSLNIDTGIIVTGLLGAFLLMCGMFYEEICGLTRKGFLRGVRAAVIVMLCLEGCLLAFLAVCGQNDTVDYGEDALIVLGAGVHGDTVSMPLKLRLDKAAEYHEKNPGALIVVSGGRGFQEKVSEAEAMKSYLVSAGVSGDRIVSEDQATSTQENMMYSKRLLDERLEDGYSVAVVTNDFHIYRSVLLAKREGFEKVTSIHTGLNWYNILPCYLRESLAVVKTWILG